MSQEDDQHLGKYAQDVTRARVSRRSARALQVCSRETQREVQNIERAVHDILQDSEISNREFDSEKNKIIQCL